MKWFADPYDGERRVAHELPGPKLHDRDPDLLSPIDPATNELRIDLAWLVRWSGGRATAAT
jgi:hypothetical protein